MDGWEGIGAGMDARLMAWGRAVKQRRRSEEPANRLAVLWLFTDTLRLPDPLPAIARLPRGLCGVVFRHDKAAERPALALQVAKLCKRRDLDLVVAGDVRLALKLGAGIHLRGGRWQGRVRPGSVRLGRWRLNLVTSSAHDFAEIRRAQSAGAQIIFLSPVFPTPTHPGAVALGAVRWVRLARQFKGLKLYCLGGVSGKNIRLLGHFGAGAGAITALTL